MSKKKKFLSLLMGVISSFSIAGAKGKNKNVKDEDIYYYYTDILKELDGDDALVLPEEDTKNYNVPSIDEQIIEKLKNEIIPNLNDLNKLNNKEDIKFFSNILLNNEFKQSLEDLSHESRFSEISKLIFEKYKDIWEDEAVLDLQKSVQKASYGYFEEGAKRGCGVVLDNAKDKLGEGHCFNFAEFYFLFLDEKEVKPIFLQTVFCHLAISDFYRLESISYEEKGVCDLMRQTILGSYVGEEFLDLKCLTAMDRTKEEHNKFWGKVIAMNRRGKGSTQEKWDLVYKCNDKLRKNQKELAKKVNDLLSRANRKIEIPWFEKALDSITRVYDFFRGGITYFRWSRFSLIHFKALFSKTLKMENCLQLLW